MVLSKVFMCEMQMGDMEQYKGSYDFVLGENLCRRSVGEEGKECVMRQMKPRGRNGRVQEREAARRLGYVQAKGRRFQSLSARMSGGVDRWQCWGWRSG